SPEVQQEYQTSRRQITDRGDQNVLATFKKAMEYEVAFVKAGGLLAAGVDPTGNGGALPGFGDQRNYQLFIEAGFSPPQAVQILSANGAKVIGVDRELGTVEAGKIADLVVIDGHPDADPMDFNKTQLVFKGGVGYDSPKLIAAVKGLVGVR